MWSAKFGKNRFEYGRILRETHTSLYEEVGSKYGLERGDSIEGRNVSHLNKRDYIRKTDSRGKTGRESGQRASVYDTETGNTDFKP